MAHDSILLEKSLNFAARIMKSENVLLDKSLNLSHVSLNTAKKINKATNNKPHP